MVYTPHTPSDEALGFMDEAYSRDGIWFTPVEAGLLHYLMTHGFASAGELSDIFWLEEDSLADFELRISVHLCKIRRKCGDLIKIESLPGFGYRMIRYSDFPIARPCPEDPLAAIAVEFFDQYNIKLSVLDAKGLNFFCRARIARYPMIDSLLWPDARKDAEEMRKKRHIFLRNLRRKLGDLIQIYVVRGHAMELKRLGPVDNPMFERK